MENRQIDKDKTKQVRINEELHRLLKIKSATEKRSLKDLIEEYLWTIVEKE